MNQGKQGYNALQPKILAWGGWVVGALYDISSLILYMSSVGQQQKSCSFMLLEDFSLNLVLFHSPHSSGKEMQWIAGWF